MNKLAYKLGVHMALVASGLSKEAVDSAEVEMPMHMQEHSDAATELAKVFQGIKMDVGTGPDNKTKRVGGQHDPDARSSFWGAETSSPQMEGIGQMGLAQLPSYGGV